jgi:hypothetical protein
MNWFCAEGANLMRGDSLQKRISKKHFKRKFAEILEIIGLFLFMRMKFSGNPRNFVKSQPHNGR